MQLPAEERGRWEGRGRGHTHAPHAATFLYGTRAQHTHGAYHVSLGVAKRFHGCVMECCYSVMCAGGTQRNGVHQRHAAAAVPPVCAAGP